MTAAGEGAGGQGARARQRTALPRLPASGAAFTSGFTFCGRLAALIGQP